MRKMLLAAALVAGLGSSANAALIYGVNEQDELVTFNSATPGTILSRTAITGLTDSIKAIDFRLAGGGLYGLTADLSLVRISLSGVATTIGTNLPLVGTEFGFDFNQSIDRLRIVSNTDQNYVVNPNTGTVQLVATDVNYPAAGAPDADVTGSAYTPSNFGGATLLYGIDARNDLLVTQNNNGGVLTAVGPLGTNIGSRVSFDIARDGTGYVLDSARFYRVNLSSGALTLIGNTGESLYGIAAAIPEPNTWAMMIGGVGFVGGALRRSRRSGSLATA